jgi:uncharacterized protein with HEPN domain
MSNSELLIERMESILECLERIPRRFADVRSPSDFTDTPSGVDRMDAISMVLIAVGEEFKTIDRQTNGSLLAGYPEINWRGVIGVRDFLAHGYFQINALQLFGICRDDVPGLIQTVQAMIRDLAS